MSSTIPRVEGVPPETEGAVTDVTAETLPVEEVALGAQSLHHVDPLGAEVAGVASTEPRREILADHTLRGRRRSLPRSSPAALERRSSPRDACYESGPAERRYDEPEKIWHGCP